MLLKFCDQTYEIYLPNSTNKFLGFGPAPPVPIKWTEDLIRYDINRSTTVFEDKTVVKHYDGVVHVYYRKPTITSIIEMKGGTGEYARFHTDGSVEHGYCNEYYFWGPESIAELGDYYETVESYNYVEEDDVWKELQERLEKI